MKLFALRRRGLNFDVVSVHFVTEGILMLALRRIFGWPFVFIMEGYNILEARVAKWADQVIAISNDIVRKCEFAHGFRPSHIPIGVDKNRFSPSVDGAEIRSRLLRGGQKLVLCVCRLEPRKDLPTLILAMKQVCSKMEARLVVVGDGLLKNQLERLIQESGLSESVRIDTEAVYDDLPQYYRAADVFALPTLYEGLGIVFLEAMSSETPIVSTRVDGVTEILGSAGLLVPPRNPNALADAITQVLTNEGLRETLITSGRRTVAAFEWEPLVYRYDSVYKQAAQSFTDLASQG